MAAVSTSIFFSHTSRDAGWCNRLAAEAKAFGITPYLAEHDVEPGTDLAAKIQNAIRRSAAVLVLLTDNSADSAYVHQEVGYAHAQGKLVIPLVQPEHVQDQLAMLTGMEYIPFDFRNPNADRAAFHTALQEFAERQQRQEAAGTLVLLACAALLLFALSE